MAATSKRAPGYFVQVDEKGQPVLNLDGSQNIVLIDNNGRVAQVTPDGELKVAISGELNIGDVTLDGVTIKDADGNQAKVTPEGAQLMQLTGSIVTERLISSAVTVDPGMSTDFAFDTTGYKEIWLAGNATGVTMSSRTYALQFSSSQTFSGSQNYRYDKVWEMESDTSHGSFWSVSKATVYERNGRVRIINKHTENVLSIRSLTVSKAPN